MVNIGYWFPLNTQYLLFGARLSLGPEIVKSPSSLETARRHCEVKKEDSIWCPPIREGLNGEANVRQMFGHTKANGRSNHHSVLGRHEVQLPGFHAESMGLVIRKTTPGRKVKKSGESGMRAGRSPFFSFF